MILNMENIYKEVVAESGTIDRSDVQCEQTAQEHFDLSYITDKFSVDNYYNERPMMDEFFKRFTVKLMDIDGYNLFHDRLYNEKYEVYNNASRTENRVRELNSKLYEISNADKKEFDSEEKYKEAVKKIADDLEKERKLKEKLSKNYNNLHVLMNDLTIEHWNTNKAPDGAKLMKRCKQYGVSKEFLDWATTQEKTGGKIVQVTINPTIQAITGMANFAKSGSWNGYNGTSCQDTRHDESYSVHLVGALADDKTYIIQMNYLEDNEPAFEYYQEHGSLEGYKITDNDNDILFNDNFQDKLKARANARLWDLMEADVSSEREDEMKIKEWQKALKGFVSQFWFLKTIKGYGSDKTKQELHVALSEIKEQVNIVVTDIR